MINLDTIFRSIINFKNKDGKDTISQQDLLKNFRNMQQIVPEAPDEKEYKVLYYFILNYVKGCDKETELPSYDFLKNHFENVEGNESVLAVLEKVKAQQPYIGHDFRSVLKMYNNDMNILQLEKAANNMLKISTTGMEIGKGKNKRKIYGILEAISYFANETKDLQRGIVGIKTESQVVSPEDSDEMIQEYQKAEEDPTEAIGINTWLKQFDEATNGLKSGELMFLLAYTGHCKTTFAMNMMYRAIYGGWNTAYITLEMSFDEIRRHLYVLHSCNPRFREVYPEHANIVGKITYNNVRYGRLTAEEKEYWHKVCRDFNKNFKEESETYGRCFIWQPEKTVTTLSDIEFKMRQYQQELQLIGRDLEFVIIDYIGLMGADASERTRDGRETVNNIIKNLKRTCITFNNGKGVRILSPHQSNRDGYREAMKNNGIYYLTALSDFNETERSADLVASLFKFDEGNNNNRLKVCCLKNRRNEPFKPFDAAIDFESGFIWNSADIMQQSTGIDLIDLSQGIA